MSSVPPGTGELAGDRGPDLALRETDLRLARLLLRVGVPAAAQAALEAAHAEAPLTGSSLQCLAEARWRMGALPAAGRAAEELLAGGAGSPLATVIAAEAAMADGRPADGRALLARSPAIPPEEIETIFAGKERSELWPADPLAAEALRGLPPAADERDVRSVRAPVRSVIPFPPVTVSQASSEAPAAETAAAATTEAAAAAALAEAAALVRAGDAEAAALRLLVLLRRAPGTAPAVIETLGGASGPLAALARGDACQLLGRTAEAERAYHAAIAEIPGVEPPGPRSSPPDPPGTAVPDGARAPVPPPSSSPSQEENP